MFKKKRIKKEFDAAIAEGDDAKIELLMRENPWLADYVSAETEETDIKLKRICSAIGIMEDELNAPVPIDEIEYSLESDFNINIPRMELSNILENLTKKGYIQIQNNNYSLTAEGGRICDNFLNKISQHLYHNPNHKHS
ncbi:MAG: hypothetical protein ACTSWN_14040 [Promethearchaeota archaeon]